MKYLKHFESYSSLEQTIIDIFQEVIDDYDIFKLEVDENGRSIYPYDKNVGFRIQDPAKILGSDKSTILYLTFFVGANSSYYKNILRDINCLRPRLKSMGYTMVINRYTTTYGNKVMDITIEAPEIRESNEVGKVNSMELDIKDALYDIIDEYDMYEVEEGNYTHEMYGICYQLYPELSKYILSIYFFKDPNDDSFTIGKKFNTLLDTHGNSNIYTFKSRLESMGYNVNMIRYATCVDFTISSK